MLTKRSADVKNVARDELPEQSSNFRDNPDADPTSAVAGAISPAIDGDSSYIYEGTVRHRRKLHAHNEFKISTFMFLLDLDELDCVFRSSWLWSTCRAAYGRFRRSDHMKRFDLSTELKQCISTLIEQQGISSPVGKVRLLTQLRYCGFQMNPVSFYYCYDPSDRFVVAIVTEVNNTPWGEQHTYVIPGLQAAGKLIVADRVDKTFHVSPFMDLDMHYRMLFTHPGKKIGIKMENYQREEKIFDVSLSLKRRPINRFELAKVAVKYPMFSVRVFVGIYYQALKLYLKRVPFFPHPRSN